MSEAIVNRLRAAGCVFAEEEAALLVSAASGAELESLVARRVAGEPLEHVLGWVDFAGLRIAVDAGVFVPRQRTTFLVDLAVAACPTGTGLTSVRSPTAPCLTSGREGGVVVDLCCGCGAIGLVIATRVPGVELHAVDIEPAAVACARRNLAGVGEVYAGDLVAPLPDRLRGRVDVLVANVPYVPTDQIAGMPTEARDHEPPVTLDGGSDGLAVVRRLAVLATEWLAPGGTVLVETSVAQAAAAQRAFADADLDARTDHDPERAATVVSGVKHTDELRSLG